MRRTRLYANRNHALAARKQAAKTGLGEGFGFEALAVQDFFDEAWMIWGDARRLITPLERSLLVWKLLGEQHVLGHTLGTARLLEGFLEQAAGLFEATLLAATATTSETLKNAVEAIAVKYYEAVFERSLIEPGDAAVFLVQRMPKTQVELGEYVDLLPAQRRLLDNWDTDLSAVDTPICIEPLDAEVEPTFLVAAGATAVPGLMKDEIESYLAKTFDEVEEVFTSEGDERKRLDVDRLSVADSEVLFRRVMAGESLAKKAEDATVLRSVLVLAKKPGELFRALSPYFNARKIACAVEESVCFADTWVGKACLAVWQILHEDGHWLFAATDFAYNPLSTMTSYATEALNAAYRGDRRLSVADVCLDLEQQSTFSLFKVLLMGSSAAQPACGDLGGISDGDCLPPLSDFAKEQDWCLGDRLREVVANTIPFNERDRELAMLEALLQAIETAQNFGLCAQSIFDMLQELKVTSAQETNDGESSFGCVLFSSLSTASRLAEKSYGLVIVGDVSSEAFALTETHSSLEAFAAQLGIEIDCDPLQDAYRQFIAAEKAARRQFTCVFSRRNEAFEEAFVSSIYDEYLTLLAANESPDGVSEVSESATKYRGEERVNEGLGLNFSQMESVQTYSEIARGKLSYANVLDYLPVVNEKGVRVPVLSASAIESYLNCPYQWFINHALGCSSLDEAYDGRTKGTFVHEVFATLFSRLKAQGLRLSEDVLQLGGLFDGVFDEVRDHQWERTYDRMIPLTETERQETELLRGVLRRNLQLQMALPGDFIPQCFEYKILPDEGVDYAGARLRGSVDRIDINPKTGDFVVLDYKGSSSKHAAPYKPSESEGMQEDTGGLLPAYVQSLVYAQAIRRKGFADTTSAELDSSVDAGVLGPHCAGALYLGYRAKAGKKLLEGSYDQLRYKAADCVGADSQVKGDMSQFLDMIEQGLTPYVQALTTGDIAGAPRSNDSCKYCPLAGSGVCVTHSEEGGEQSTRTNLLTAEWGAE